MKTNTKSIKKKNSIFKILLAVLFVGFVIYCSGILIKNYADINRLNAKAAEYDAQYEQQVKENDEIKAILESEDKDDYIEQKAREKGYVKDGETVFYDASSGK